MPEKEAGSAGEPFGSNAVRLNGRQWLAAAGIVLAVMLLVPPLWARVERFDTGPDYRIPSQLSEDYWLYGRWLRRAAGPGRVVVLGDSVVWGEYVLPDGTLSHFLNRETGQTDRFVNAGVDGFFPLAMEGLLRYYGQALHGRKVILHCNVLWMSSPKTDLSSDREEQFNHARLVPQLFGRVPSYRADANARLSAAIARRVGFMGWIGHLQSTRFGQQGIPAWTLADDGNDPPRYPNTWKNPLAHIGLAMPAFPEDTAKRGPSSPRHRPWAESGQEPASFEWVPLEKSLQWAAFQRVVRLLRERDNDVLVVLGPFNEYIIADDSRPAYRKLRAGIEQWLLQNRVAYVAPETLPSALYADASHPLSEGYALLAKRLLASPEFAREIAEGAEIRTQRP